jgi:hypothetical protein
MGSSLKRQTREVCRAKAHFGNKADGGRVEGFTTRLKPSKSHSERAGARLQHAI